MREAGRPLHPDSPSDSSASENSVKGDRPGPRSSKKKSGRRETAREERARRREEEMGRRRAEGSRSAALSGMSEMTDDDDVEVDILGDAEIESADGPFRTSADKTVRSRTLEVPTECYVWLETMEDASASNQSEQAGQTKTQGASKKKKKFAGKSRAALSTPGKYVGVYKMREHFRQKNAVIRQIDREKVESEARRDYALMTKSQSQLKGSDSDQADSARERRALTREVKADPTKQSAGELSEAIDVAMGTVVEIARKSDNRKGAFVRELKEAAEDARWLADEQHRQETRMG